MRRRRLLLGALAVLLLVAAYVFVALARGKYDTSPRDAVKGGGEPAWTKPCYRSLPVRIGSVCARVQGRVVWRQLKDPDGDGDSHLVVVARLRARIVKIEAGGRLGQAGAPPPGARVEAVGWLIRGAGGRQEIDALELHWGAGAGSLG